MAYSNVYKVFALGTQSGKVVFVNESNTSEIELGYRGTGPITSLTFTESNKLLAIGLE